MYDALRSSGWNFELSEMTSESVFSKGHNHEENINFACYWREAEVLPVPQKQCMVYLIYIRDLKEILKRETYP